MPQAKTATFGAIVQYQPTVQEYPMSSDPAAAIVTSVNPDDGTATLVVFLPAAGYVVSRRGISEGPGDGQFQQLGAVSTRQQTAEAQKEAEKKAEEDRQKEAKKAAEEAKKQTPPHVAAR